MELVTIFRAFNPADAQLVRSRLEAASFHASVADELSALSIDGYGMAVGGIRVQVPESEATEAKEFLAAGPSDATLPDEQ
jgi:Putative prokaryotic signal transducing protein